MTRADAVEHKHTTLHAAVAADTIYWNALSVKYGMDAARMNNLPEKQIPEIRKLYELSDAANEQYLKAYRADLIAKQGRR